MCMAATATHEMWALGPNVLSFQFHPELPVAEAREKILGPLTAAGRLDSEAAAAAGHSFHTFVPHQAAMATLLRHFATHGFHSASAMAEEEVVDVTTQPDGAQGAQRLDAGGGASGGEVGVPEGEAAVAAAVADVVSHARAAFDAGMRQGLVDGGQLADMNRVAASSCAAASDAAEDLVPRSRAAQVCECVWGNVKCSCTAVIMMILSCDSDPRCSLARFLPQLFATCSQRLQAQAAGVQKALDGLPQLEALLDGLVRVVDDLDVRSRALERAAADAAARPPPSSQQQA